MKAERSGSSDYVVYVTHSSSAIGGAVSTSADPSSLSAVMKDQVVALGISAADSDALPSNQDGER